MNRFEGSFLGNAERLDPTTVLECGVCWWVYDPDLGDDTWQIPAGTTFAELPAHWRCPGCDAAQEQFMVLRKDEHNHHALHRPQIPTQRKAARQRQHELLQAYAEVDRHMRSLPVYNDKLDIRIIGLHARDEGMLCVAATPWCMNILLLPENDAAPRMEGTTREVAFPSGNYTFVAGELPGIGRVDTCSLFSPMEQFDDPEVVAEVARHAIRELLTGPDGPDMSRRRFLRGGRHTRDRATTG